MITVVTKRLPFYSRQEIWFYAGETFAHKNNDLFYQSLVKPSFRVVGFTESTTSLINLLGSEDNLFEAVKPNTRNEIRRAEKLGAGFKSENLPDSYFIRKYLKTYRSFAGVKNLDPNLNSGRLNVLSKQQILTVTTATLNGTDVTFHAYLRDNQERVVLLYSHFNTEFADDIQRGFINKYHHWKDILMFRNLGISWYDWGGLDHKNTPGIAKFKESFGGTPHTFYSFQMKSGLYSLIKR